MNENEITVTPNDCEYAEPYGWCYEYGYDGIKCNLLQDDCYCDACPLNCKYEIKEV